MLRFPGTKAFFPFLSLLFQALDRSPAHHTSLNFSYWLPHQIRWSALPQAKGSVKESGSLPQSGSSPSRHLHEVLHWHSGRLLRTFPSNPLQEGPCQMFLYFPMVFLPEEFSRQIFPYARQPCLQAHCHHGPGHKFQYPPPQFCQHKLFPDTDKVHVFYMQMLR